MENAMENALIVTSSEKSRIYFAEILQAAGISHTAVSTCGQARRTMLEREFELVIVNSPLKDESGEELARQIALQDCGQVILVVRAEHYGTVISECENDGVLVVEKPVNKGVLWSALKLARAASNRMLRLRTENQQLKQRVEDIRLADKAKRLLMLYLHMSEQEAHRYIEKQAMDLRLPKRTVAEGVIKSYES